MAETYLVTGGAGFIGSHLVDGLLARGHRVRVLDNFSTGSRENIAHVVDDVELIEGDLRSYERVHNAVRGADRVLHIGALPSVPRSVQDPLTTSEVNVTGTLNTLLAARDEGVERVVLASSSSVYGAAMGVPKVETMQTLPISPYGVSKLAAEQYCMAFHHVYGVETVALRYFNVFGPRQNPFSQYSAVVPKFILAALAGTRPVVYGDGTQTRDFTYVSNVVEGTILAAETPGAPGTTMNLACGESHTLLQFVDMIVDAAGRPVEPEFVPPREGDIKESFADVTLARDVLGFQPSVSFGEGVARTFAYLRERFEAGEEA